MVQQFLAADRYWQKLYCAVLEAPVFVPTVARPHSLETRKLECAQPAGTRRLVLPGCVCCGEQVHPLHAHPHQATPLVVVATCGSCMATGLCTACVYRMCIVLLVETACVQVGTPVCCAADRLHQRKQCWVCHSTSRKFHSCYSVALAVSCCSVQSTAGRCLCQAHCAHSCI